MINADDLRAAGAARLAAYSARCIPDVGHWRNGAPSGILYRAQASRGEEGMAGGTAARRIAFGCQYRAQTVERDGKQFHEVSGYATAYEKPYDMYDMFGPYEEHVAQGAATATLAADPDVVFLVNHTGLAMARTNGTLTLSEDAHGLADKAYLNPDRQDVRDLVAGIDDGVITEQSFAFRIDEAWWNDDFTEFKIVQFDINRGDVSAVNYGANPATDIAARQQEIARMLRHAPEQVRRGLLSASSAENVLDRVLDMAEARTARPKATRSNAFYEALIASWEADS